MKTGRFLFLCALASTTSFVPSGYALAQSNPIYTPLSEANAAIYRPDSGPAPHVAFIVAHRTANNLNTEACTELAARGFLTLCFNTRFHNNETDVDWEKLAFDVKEAVDLARAQPGITRVILLGHSGGAPLMAYYQAVAENGPSYCRGPSKLSPCDDDDIPESMIPADGIVFPDAHPGNGAQALHALNPSVSIVDGEIVVDPALDPFNPANGFNPDGASHYSDEFRERYYRAQSRVMNDKIAEAEALRARILAGQHLYPDEDIFLVPFGDQAGAARLDLMDPSVPEFSATVQPRPFLRNDGTIITQIAHSVKNPEPDQARDNRRFRGGVKILTITSFLSANAIRSTHSTAAVDHCSTNSSATCAVQSIEVPTLILAMGAYNHIRQQEIMFEVSTAEDKEYIVIEGALHGYNPCTQCETFPGQYANSERNTFDHIAQWAEARF
jgi:hypothetical protein